MKLIKQTFPLLPALLFAALALRAETPGGVQTSESSAQSMDADPLVPKVLAALQAMQRFSWEQGVFSQYYVEINDPDMMVTVAEAQSAGAYLG